jgi:hypothetical protein
MGLIDIHLLLKTNYRELLVLSRINLKQDQQGKAAFNERNHPTTKQQVPVARIPGEPQTKTGQGTRLSTDNEIETIRILLEHLI